MADVAEAMARLRHAGGVLPVGGLPLAAMEKAAEEAGLRIHLVDDRDGGLLAVLGWADIEPAASSDRPRLLRIRLTPRETMSYLAAYAMLTATTEDTLTVAAVVELLRACTDRYATTWAVPALERTLPRAGLLTLLPGGLLALGPRSGTLDPVSYDVLSRAAVRLRNHRAFPETGRLSGPRCAAVETARGRRSWVEAGAVECLRALEAASAPLDARDWPQLADPDTHREIVRILASIGRALNKVELREGRAGYIAGWHPDVEGALRTSRTGRMTQADLAVLAMIYLYDRLIPEAGGPPSGQRPMEQRLREHTGPDGRACIPYGVIGESLSRLRARGLIDHRNRIANAALQRLSPQQHARLRENAVLLAEPDSLVAEELRRRRTNDREGLPS